MTLLKAGAERTQPEKANHLLHLSVRFEYLLRTKRFSFMHADELEQLH